MSKQKSNRRILSIILIGLALVIAWLVYERFQEINNVSKKSTKNRQPIPVEITQIKQGPISRIRSFSGTVQAFAEFVVSPKVDGRVEQLMFDVSDTVSRGQLVARLDNAEYVQTVNQVQADLEVAEANLSEAESLLTIAQRELDRIQRLLQRGISSESQLDSAKAEHLAKQAHLKVSIAQVSRAQATLESARIRLGYTKVNAGWNGGTQLRVIAERYVDEGETVSASTPLMRIVELNPVKVIIHVSEQDYVHFAPEQRASLTTDAYSGRSFPAKILRISPVFHENTRQAEIEFEVSNPEHKLKPGMFANVKVTLETIENAMYVSDHALVKREGRYGLFMVSDDRSKVSWHPVEVGITQDNKVQITGKDLSGPVVILGQQLLNDGSTINVVTQNITPKI